MKLCPTKTRQEHRHHHNHHGNPKVGDEEDCAATRNPSPKPSDTTVQQLKHCLVDDRLLDEFALAAADTATKDHSSDEQAAVNGSYALRQKPKRNAKFQSSKGTKVAAGKKDHACQECGKEFSSIKGLSGHMRCHPQRASRALPDCGGGAAAAAGPVAVTTTTSAAVACSIEPAVIKVEVVEEPDYDSDVSLEQVYLRHWEKEEREKAAAGVAEMQEVKRKMEPLAALESAKEEGESSSGKNVQGLAEETAAPTTNKSKRKAEKKEKKKNKKKIKMMKLESGVTGEATEIPRQPLKIRIKSSPRPLDGMSSSSSSPAAAAVAAAETTTPDRGDHQQSLSHRLDDRVTAELATRPLDSISHRKTSRKSKVISSKMEDWNPGTVNRGIEFVDLADGGVRDGKTGVDRGPRFELLSLL